MVTLLAYSLLATVPQTAGPDTPVQLEIRVFDGVTEVTAEATLKVFPAGKRDGTPIAGTRTRRGHVFDVAPGVYDVQATHQRQGRILNVRWAERLSVMRYPDEHGVHLEVVNLRPGYGALQVRADAAPQASAFPPGQREQPVGRTFPGDGYSLIVAPAGTYDVLVQADGSSSWWPDLEVPADRTRMKSAGR